MRSGSLPRARWVARNACAWDHPGCICAFAAVAGTSVAATTLPTVMPGGTSKRPVIRLSRATTLPRDGAGALSMTSKSIWQARRRTTVQSRASSELEFDRILMPTATRAYLFFIRHEPSQFSGGGFCFRSAIRASNAIEGPSSGAASIAAANAARASSQRRSRYAVSPSA